MSPEQYTRTYLPGAYRVSAMEKLGAIVARKSMGLVVGGATGAFLIASIGVSAHTGVLPFAKPPGVHQNHGDELALVATGPRVTREPSDKPAASPTPENKKPEIKKPATKKPATEKPDPKESESWSKPKLPPVEWPSEPWQGNYH